MAFASPRTNHHERPTMGIPLHRTNHHASPSTQIPPLQEIEFADVFPPPELEVADISPPQSTRKRHISTLSANIVPHRTQQLVELRQALERAGMDEHGHCPSVIHSRRESMDMEAQRPPSHETTPYAQTPHSLGLCATPPRSESEETAGLLESFHEYFGVRPTPTRHDRSMESKGAEDDEDVYVFGGDLDADVVGVRHYGERARRFGRGQWRWNILVCTPEMGTPWAWYDEDDTVPRLEYIQYRTTYDDDDGVPGVVHVEYCSR